MSLDTGSRFVVSKADLKTTTFVPDPDAPAARVLSDGQARLVIDHFALTANNITYAAFGQAMKYWQFFPAADSAWGNVPVWGFATVSESRVEGLQVGQRFYGYYPPGTHLVVQAGRINARGFVDEAPHRAELAAVYNRYVLCATDPDWQPRTEGLQAVLRPLYVTSFLIDDFLADNQFFGAQQVLLSSASSKTAFGTAFCLMQRRGQAGAPRVVGLTSAANLAFTQRLGCFDDVITYDTLEKLDPAVRSVYVDFAGNAALRRSIHTHFDSRLMFSSSIGGTHVNELGSGGGLPGPRPTLFFAPAQIKKRSAPPPEGWGPAVLQERMGQAWSAFMKNIDRPSAPWIHIVSHSGEEAVKDAYLSLLQGTADASVGLMVKLRG